MIAAGERDPVACVVVTAGPRAGSPCGICRQVLWEFAGDMRIALVTEDHPGRRHETTLRHLLPEGFRLERKSKR
jgi:cytidine deaminase